MMSVKNRNIQGQTNITGFLKKRIYGDRTCTALRWFASYITHFCVHPDKPVHIFMAKSRVSSYCRVNKLNPYHCYK